MIDIWKKIHYGWNAHKGEGPVAYTTITSLELGYLWLNNHPDCDPRYSYMVSKYEIRGLIKALEELEKTLK